MQAIEFTDPERLRELLDLLHDRSYDLASLKYDSLRREIVLMTTVIDEQPVEGRHKVYRAFLRILDCDDCTVADGAEVGVGDFSRIEFRQGSIVITGSLPVTLTAMVKHFHLLLEIRDEVVRTVSSLRKDYLGS